MWDLKYRPVRYGDVLGQQGNVQLLQARLRNGSALDTSYIFAGGHGQGKTTLARIHARAMLCQQLVNPKENPEPCNECDNCRDILNEEGMAFVEKDAASNGTIDHARAIVEELPFGVFGAAKRIYLFDEAHRMSRDAQDVLLKPIEDKRMVGMFCTTEPDKIRGPIRSRCEEYTIRKVTRDDILVRMRMVLEAEGVAYEDDAVLTVIDHSGGHVRDVLNRLEMVSQAGPISTTNVREYLNLGVVSVFFEILLALSDPCQAIALVESACDRVSPEEVATGLCEAAMNSYRLANGMYADFIYIDKLLAQQVFTRYGVHVLRLAEYFSRGRSMTKAGLLSDILVLSQTAGNLPAVGSPPPIMFVAGTAPANAVPVPTSAPVSNAEARPTTTPAPSTPATATAPAVLPTAPNPATPRDPRLREDGIGPTGSSDPLALTELDAEGGVPRGYPRGKEAVAKKPVKFTHTEDDELLPITPDMWKREFERVWPGRVRSG